MQAYVQEDLQQLMAVHTSLTQHEIEFTSNLLCRTILCSV